MIPFSDRAHLVRTASARKSLKYSVSEVSEMTVILKCTVSRELSPNSKNVLYLRKPITAETLASKTVP